MKILVVGGGTAGLISALILKTRLDCIVDVVYSKNIGIIGVGEGSTEHFNEFIKFVGIDSFEIIKECDATFKCGIMFDGWSNFSYLHSISYPYGNLGQYPAEMAYRIQGGYLSVTGEHLWKNKVNSRYFDISNGPAFNQYHFNTYKLNNFLMSKANKINISTIEDEIKNIALKENGEIDYLVGEKQNYNYDFYIDATGFKRLLIGKMGAKWISFGKYLKMKSAIVFPTPDENEYNLWTLAKAMDYGWRFKIPTWGRHGNGYIFDSDYITADQAKEELDREFGYDVEISKEFKFDPGHLDKVWIKNCVAIGLSGSFVEPLEATSIGTSIQQSFMLMDNIVNYSKKEIDFYNKQFLEIMNNIRDFISLHYVTKKNNTVFWKNLTLEKLPDSLKNNLEKWKNKMPLQDELLTNSHIMFSNLNFAIIMHGLRLFNVENIKKEYMSISKPIRNRIEENVMLDIIEVSKELKTSRALGHKEFLKLIKDNV